MAKRGVKAPESNRAARRSVLVHNVVVGGQPGSNETEFERFLSEHSISMEPYYRSGPTCEVEEQGEEFARFVVTQCSWQYVKAFRNTFKELIGPAWAE